MYVDNHRVITKTREIENIAELGGKLLFAGSVSSNIVVLTDWELDCAVSNQFNKTVSESGKFSLINLPDSDVFQVSLYITIINGNISWDNINWAEGVTPTLEHNVAYVVTITYIAASDSLIGSVVAGYDTGFGVELTPTPFKFENVTGASPNQKIVSNQITIHGLDSNKYVVLKCVGCVADAGTDTLSGAVGVEKVVRTSNGGTIVAQLQLQSSDLQLTLTSGSVEVNGYTSVWSVMTRAVDTTPVEFIIDPVVGQPVNTMITSQIMIIKGLEPGYMFTVAVTGGLVDAGTITLSGEFQPSKNVESSAIGTINIQLQHLTSDFELTTTTMNVSVGDYQTSWNVETKQITQRPHNLVLPAVRNVKLNSLVRSQVITVSNLEPTYPITVSANGGFVDISNTVLAGSYRTSKTVRASSEGTILLRCEQQSSSVPGTTTSITIDVGGTQVQWPVTTKLVDIIPTFNTVPMDVIQAEVDSVLVSSIIVASNLEPNHHIVVMSVDGEFDISANSRLVGQYTTYSTTTTSATGQLFARLRARSASTFKTNVTPKLIIGGGTCNWSITTRTFKNTPIGLSVTDIFDADFNVEYVTPQQTVGGLEPNTTYVVSTTGGVVSVGKYNISDVFSAIEYASTTSDGTFVVAFKQKSSVSENANTKMIIDIGDVSIVWTITTRIRRTTPQNQNITSPACVTTDPTQITCSETIFVVGLDPRIDVPISVTNGCFTDVSTGRTTDFHTSGTLTTSNRGELKFMLQGISPTDFGSCKLVTASVGGLPIEWIISTPTLPTTITPSTVPPSPIDGQPSDTATAPPTDGQPSQVHDLPILPVKKPIEFTITPNLSVTPCSTVTSDSTTVTGLEPNSTVIVSTSDGTIDAGTTSLSGTFAKTQTVAVAYNGTILLQANTKTPCCGGIPKSVNVQVGGTTSPWVVSAKPVDGTPDNFFFNDVIDAKFNTTVTSNTIVVGGLEPSCDVAISNSNGTVDAGTSGLTGKFTPTKIVTASSSGTLTVAARTTTNDCCCGTSTSTIKIGDGSTDWHVATIPITNVPSNLGVDFKDVSQADLNVPVVSEHLVITGLDPKSPIPFAAVGGQVDVGARGLSGVWSSSKLVTPSVDGTVVVAVQQLSSNIPNTTKTVKLNVGSTTLDWTVTTKFVDTQANSTALFNPITNAELNTRYTSNIATVSGLEPNTNFSVTTDKGEIQAGTANLTGNWGTSSSTSTDNTGSFVMQARQTTGGVYSVDSPTTITVASNKFGWDVQTRPPIGGGTMPDFTDVVDAAISDTIISNTITISDLEPSYNYTITATNGLVCAGATNLSNTFAPSMIVTSSPDGSIVAALKQTTSANLITTTTASLTVGAATIDWKTTTVAGTTLQSGVITTVPTDIQSSNSSGSTGSSTTVLPPTGYDISYGCSVAIDGDTYVVGAKTEDVYGTASGSAYIHIKVGGDWVFDIKLVPQLGEANDWFGASVDISGNTVVVGAPTANSNRLRDSGAAYVFTRTGSTWSYRAKLTASDCRADEKFGQKVYIDTDVIFVTANDYQIDGTVSTPRGAVYVFVSNGTTWVESQKITDYEQTPTGVWAGQFGSSISSYGPDTIVIGARRGMAAVPGSALLGKAITYNRTTNGYVKDYTFAPTDLVAQDDFGACVAMNSKYVVIGCPRRNNTNGIIYIYQRTDASWMFVKTISTIGGLFGTMFRMSEKYLFVGSAYTSTQTGGAPTGLAWLFDPINEWSMSKVLPVAESKSTFFGNVDISDATIVASKLRNADTTGVTVDEQYAVLVKQL